MCCPVGFLEEFIAVFEVTISQIDTENMTKNPKFSNFQRFYAFCFQIFDRLRQLER